MLRAAGYRDHRRKLFVTRDLTAELPPGGDFGWWTVAEIGETAVALGIAPDGLDFEAIDRRQTHLVILLVNPANRTSEHIRTLGEIARLLSSGALRSGLVGAESVEEALAVIRAAEVAAA